MPIDLSAILDLKTSGEQWEYTDRETMLYALGIGFGADPAREQELPFVYERGLRAVPTLATVVGWGLGVPTDALGINVAMALAGEDSTIFHRPMPVAASLLIDGRVHAVYDKGEGKGAIIVREVVLRDARDGEPIATLLRSLFARGDGGRGGSREGAPAPHPMPERAPDTVIEYPTALNQALIYRLSGDRNPLHADPEVARAAGFQSPILHGLCTGGFTCRAVLEAYCDFAPERIASHQVRYSAPVYPGDRLHVELWRDGDTVSFEASVPARGVKVIRNGRAVLR